jgi:hypothetical protein
VGSLHRLSRIMGKYDPGGPLFLSAGEDPFIGFIPTGAGKPQVKAEA